MTAALATPSQPAPPGAQAPQAAPRIVIRPAPRREPPFEDEQARSHVLPGYDQVLPFERPPAPFTRAPAPRRDRLPDPAVWGRRLLVGLTETAAGRRPLQQLGSLLSASVAHGIGQDFERCASEGAPHWLNGATVRTVRGSEPADGVAELCATLATGRRVHAVALRLEARQGRWRCTRLQLG